MYSLFLEGTVSAIDAVSRRVLLPKDGLVRSDARNLGGYDCDDDHTKAQAVAEVMVHNWQIARSIVEGHGGMFIGILQPNAHVGSPRTDHLRGRLDEELGKNYSAVYSVARTLIQKTQSPWIVDLSEAYDGDTILLIDDFHVTEPGNQVLADRVGRLLRQQGWPPAM